MGLFVYVKLVVKAMHLKRFMCTKNIGFMRYGVLKQAVKQVLQSCSNIKVKGQRFIHGKKQIFTYGGMIIYYL